MKVFVDDIRKAPEKYDLVFRNGEDFLKWKEENEDVRIQLLSLDHDLGEYCIDGYDIVKKLVSDHVFNIDIIQFHTDNIVGMKNMYMYLRSAKVAGVIPETTNIIKRKVVCIDGNEHFASYDVIK